MTPNARRRDTRTFIDMFNLHVAWYVWGALEIFLKVLAAQNGQFNSRDHYGKLMAIVQSLGTGKSRLMDELGKKRVAVTYTLRYGEQLEYPPGNLEVTELLRDAVRGAGEREGLESATTMALLASSADEGMWLAPNGFESSAAYQCSVGEILCIW